MVSIKGNYTVIEFGFRPDDKTRKAIKALGFYWVPDEQVWRIKSTSPDGAILAEKIALAATPFNEANKIRNEYEILRDGEILFSLGNKRDANLARTICQVLSPNYTWTVNESEPYYPKKEI